MAQVTLVGERQATVGHEFVYRGPQPPCRECKVKGACLNQEVGKRYRILHVREVRHACPLNEETVRVVSVEARPPDCSLPARAALEGSIVAFEGVVCFHAACPNFRLCHPVSVDPGTRLRVDAVREALACPLGYDLVSTRVAYAD